MIEKKRVTFDLIHAHFMDLGYVGAILKESTDMPLVLTAHGGDVYDLPFRKSWYNDLTKYTLKSADKVITVSRSNAEKLLSLGVSSNKLHIIPNGYDPKIFKMLPQSSTRQKLNLPSEKRILLSVGNLVDIKGHTYLIDAMRIIQKKQANALLVIVGSGPLERKLRKKITKLGLGDKILLVGRRSHHEVALWMNASDVFILPSLSEGFPTVVPEALACGKPIIGTKVGGVPEVLHNHEVGMVVNPRDSVALADAILQALDMEWAKSLISNYAEKYSWNSIIPQILRVYNSIRTKPHNSDPHGNGIYHSISLAKSFVPQI